jgi:hypothetical protein
MLEFMSFLTKNYPNFHEVASIKTMKNIVEQFDTIFNEENKIRVLNKKQFLLDKDYIEINMELKEKDYTEKFYNKPLSKDYYLSIKVNDFDKTFIIFKKLKQILY